MAEAEAEAEAAWRWSRVEIVAGVLDVDGGLAVVERRG